MLAWANGPSLTGMKSRNGGGAMSTRTVRAHVLMTVFLVGFLLAPLTPHHAPPVAASGGLTRSSSPALSSCFRDDFTSTSLSPGWQFVDPLGDSNYQLS